MNFNVARIATVAAVSLAVLAAGYLMLGGASNDYQVTAVFENAGQLVKGNFVEVAGRPVGEITEIELADDNEVKITMSIDDEIAPLHEGTTLTQRLSSLSGIANRYIAINPGPQSNAEVADGGLISPDETTSAVDLDTFYQVMDRDTRKNVRSLIRQLAVAYEGRGSELNEAYKYAGPAFGSGSQILADLLKDQEAFERFLVDAARLNTALADRRSELASLVTNASLTAEAIGSQENALAEALEVLPSTLSQANTTFPNLRETLDNLDPLLTDLDPTVEKLTTFLDDLKPVVKKGGPVLHDLALTVNADGKNNDARDLLENSPQLSSASEDATDAAIEALKGLQPILAFARPYAVDLTSFLSKLGASAALYDANGHIVRVMPNFLNFAVSGSSLTQVADADREFSGIETNQVKRCPGGATQSAADGSNPFLPFTGFDCASSTLPPP